MFLNKTKGILFLIGAFTCWCNAGSTIASAQQVAKRFTVAEEIGLTLFSSPSGEPPKVHFSPDRNYFAVWTERGRLDLNRVDDSLRFYRSQDVKTFLEHSDQSQPPSPIWVVERSSNEGSSINNWRWLADSSGVVFLERTAGGIQRLVLAALGKRMIEPLTSTIETVKAFDVRDRQHYVYTVGGPARLEKMQAERQPPSIVGTGRALVELIVPNNPKTAGLTLSARDHLWAVAGNKRFEVIHDGAPILLSGNLVLSPDGGSLITTLPVQEVPPSWETLYPPPFASDPYRMRAGRGSIHQYVRIKLQNGAIESLTDAPVSSDAGLWAGADGSPHWSNDGQGILLPDTFLSSKGQVPSRPCVAFIDLSAHTRTCVETLKGRTETGVEEGYHETKDACFVGENKDLVIVSFYNNQDLSIGVTEYKRYADGSWEVVREIKGEPEVEHNGLEITVKQGLNDPPMLIAASNGAARVIWDPNPQLKKIELGVASVYKWKDKEGRDWKGGLFKPSNYQPGQRYPLVIQTHGFREFEFKPSGIYPTAFAARALAAAGIAVLQVAERACPVTTSSEGPCAVSGYEAGASQLVSEGLVDPEKIGIIGFSRTCFYVMEMLTTSSLHLKAASITDGVMANYLQYMTSVDTFGNDLAREFDSMIGTPPFGDGLQQWLKRSPAFNLDKISAPLMVVGEGPVSLLSMWEPYAGLRYLQKPVDVVMLNTDEHVLTNPAVRIASQGGTVDWFRFWLKDEEDSDPAKGDQYARWRNLRKLEERNSAQ
jgi:dipeptidyl aminopeptidase/acylaminoacyl peptidase